MEMLTGRLTANAKVNTTKDDRQVVNFSIAINDYYKPKNSDEGVKTVTFINCSYWMGTKVAERLTKGAIVQIGGRLHVSAYLGAVGEPKASLNCHVQYIKIHHSGKTTSSAQERQPEEAVTDDLPF